MVKLSVEPVTRVEGHGKITVSFDEGGNLDKVHFHVVEVRGFEKFFRRKIYRRCTNIYPKNLWNMSSVSPPGKCKGGR